LTRTGGINQDNLVFTILVAMLFWFWGNNLAHLPRSVVFVRSAAWTHPHHQQHPAGDQNRNTSLSSCSCRRCSLSAQPDARTWDWCTGHSRAWQTQAAVFRMGAALALLALLVGQVIIQRRGNQSFPNFSGNRSPSWAKSDRPPQWRRMVTTDYMAATLLQLAVIRLGEQVLVIAAPPGRRYYWRSRVFDL
jgi:hypothetical protein